MALPRYQVSLVRVLTLKEQGSSDRNFLYQFIATATKNGFLTVISNTVP
ncbi:hypothetical protein [Paenibacillus macquariensis]|nr:hypothetical protein [Paenibacillus macquariensis]MEC0090580.1 hypothetical protein [Paenibacillus macquariensis]